MLRPVRLDKGDKVGARGADGRAASCSSLGEREYGGVARRRESRDLQIRSAWGPGLHQGVVSTGTWACEKGHRSGLRPQRGLSPLGRLSSVALTNNFSEPRSPCLLMV